MLRLLLPLSWEITSLAASLLSVDSHTAASAAARSFSYVYCDTLQETDTAMVSVPKNLETKSLVRARAILRPVGSSLLVGTSYLATY